MIQNGGPIEDDLHALVIAEYERREREIPDRLYAPHNMGYLLMSQARERASVRMLEAAGVFPQPGTPCLEVGYGRRGALGALISWGLRAADLHGIEMDGRRASAAQSALPGADLRVGDARRMPWPADTFGLVIAWTVFSSIGSVEDRQTVAAEIERVLRPGGALLYYDFAWNNPRNPNVRAVTRRDLLALFGGLKGSSERVSLAPPLSRLIAPRSWWLATALDAIPLLRSHLVAVLVKPDASVRI